MIYDVYVSGASHKNDKWYEKLRNSLDSKITIAFFSLKETAKKIYLLDNCKIAVFYLGKPSMRPIIYTELGDAIGRNKPVIVCVGEKLPSKKAVIEYCKHRGVLITNNVTELSSTIQEYLSEIQEFKELELELELEL